MESMSSYGVFGGIVCIPRLSNEDELKDLLRDGTLKSYTLVNYEEIPRQARNDKLGQRPHQTLQEPIKTHRPQYKKHSAGLIARNYCYLLHTLIEL